MDKYAGDTILAQACKPLIVVSVFVFRLPSMSDGKTTTSNRSRGAVVTGAGNVDETAVAGACYTGEAVHDHEIPRSGKCGTSGRGTYEYGAAVAGACYTGEAVQDHEIPRSGKCGTSGRGTCEYGAAVAGACYTGEAVQNHAVAKASGMEELKPFAGCVLWLCPLGRTMSHVRRRIFSARVSELGGEIAESPNENVTHVVVGSSVTTGSFWKHRHAANEKTEVVTDAWLVESLKKCEKVSTDAYQHNRWPHVSASHLITEFAEEWVLADALLEASAQKRRKTDH